MDEIIALVNVMTRPSAAALAVTTALLAACAGTPDGAAQCNLPHTPVGAVQGSGTASPVSGQTVTVQGVVVGDFEGPAPALRGFYLQDGDDGDAVTSAGIFIFNGDSDDVSLGDVVHVTGTAGEFRDQTQIAADAIVACGTSTVQPTDVTLPLPDDAYLERFEGMLVRLPQRLFVTEHYQLGRYGEVVLSAGARLHQPTAIAQPGAGALAVQAANDRNRIILDDASHVQNPAVIPFARGGTPLSADNTLRGGDHVTGITGVLTQTSAGGTAGGIAYRVRPVQPGSVGELSGFVAANSRDSAPPDVGGTLRTASFNLLNYFNTFTGCTAGVSGAATDCRGADDEAEFGRQSRKTVAAIVAMDADIIGVIEIENDGYDPGNAIADITAKLNDATSPGRYAFIDVDAAAGQTNALGTDAIRVGFLYRPARVTPTGRTAVLNTPAFVHAGDSQPRNRPSLAQAFVQPDGGRVVISISHLKSKGSACDAPDAGDGQGNCNAVRVAAARELAAWLAADPTGTGETAVLVLGDLNAYSREDPVTALTRAGYTDLLAGSVAGGYSYAYNGQWGYLDHALASPTLLPQVTGAAAWHINADEPPVLDYNNNFKSTAQQSALYSAGPFRSSDHDPIIVGLELTPLR